MSVISTVFLIFKTGNDEECSVFIARQEHLGEKMEP